MAKHKIITVNRKILFSHGLNISATLRATVPSLDYRPKQIFFKIHLEQSRCSGFTMVFSSSEGSQSYFLPGNVQIHSGLLEKLSCL